MTHETQQTIGAWQVATFGPLPSPSMGVIRAQDEMDELADAVIAGDRDLMGREIADVVIVLSGMAEQLGIDLQAEIDRKMAINRARKWATAGDGTGRHVKETPHAP